MDSLLSKLAANIDTFLTGELLLPDPEMDIIFRCPEYGCDGELQLLSYDKLYKLRKPPRNPDDTDDNALKCFRCESVHSVSGQIAAALDHGYRRCFGRPRLETDEVIDLIWKGLPIRPTSNDHREADCWQLNLCSIQVLVNMHDRQHRKSCFKSNSNSCRYKTPHEPCQKTEVIPICNCKIQESDTNEAGKNLSRKFNQAAKKEEIERLHFSVKKRPVFMFLTDCNLSVLSVLNCNNCTKYVHDQKISLYYGAYASKHNSDNEKSLVELMTALSKYEEKIRNVKPKDHEEHESNSQPQHAQRSHASIGLGRLLSGARAATNGETVGAPLASFAARGNRIFEMSHETAVLPLTQALAYLLGEPLRSSINRDGVVLASTYDYVFRTRDDETIASMTYWDFVTIMETYPLKSVSVAKQVSQKYFKLQ